jgi:prepilin-type N-terminal cleavage/methylation domain-containing protein
MKPVRQGFTLIELLVVVAILAVMLTVGIPALNHSMNKDSARKATTDIVEACQTARARAILQQRIMVVRYRPGERTLSITGLLRPVEEGGGVPEPVAPAAEEGHPSSYQLSERLEILTWGVNFAEMKNQEESIIRFFPNGTADEFTVIFRDPDGHSRQITLDVITGQPSVEVLR